MSRSLLLVGVSIALGCVGCSSDAGSGIAPEKKLVDLNASEQQSLCQYIVDAEQGPRDVTCGDATLHIHGLDECLAAPGFDPSCTATVEQAEDCANAIGADPCNVGGDACTPLLACSSTSG